ncbi:hypothetical protein CPAV1605_237 [seawater metagenome]|uniref:Uncharacterized protein n=1 Tax=seawater metagenome TaxID=1561972 RepID=A0A5E8CLB9_9ZZZZ
MIYPNGNTNSIINVDTSGNTNQTSQNDLQSTRRYLFPNIITNTITGSLFGNIMSVRLNSARCGVQALPTSSASIAGEYKYQIQLQYPAVSFKNTKNVYIYTDSQFIQTATGYNSSQGSYAIGTLVPSTGSLTGNDYTFTTTMSSSLAGLYNIRPLNQGEIPIVSYQSGHISSNSSTGMAQMMSGTVLTYYASDPKKTITIDTSSIVNGQELYVSGIAGIPDNLYKIYTNITNNQTIYTGTSNSNFFIPAPLTSTSTQIFIEAVIDPINYPESLPGPSLLASAIIVDPNGISLPGGVGFGEKNSIESSTGTITLKAGDNYLEIGPNGIKTNEGLITSNENSDLLLNSTSTDKSYLDVDPTTNHLVMAGPNYAPGTINAVSYTSGQPTITLDDEGNIILAPVAPGIVKGVTATFTGVNPSTGGVTSLGSSTLGWTELWLSDNNDQTNSYNSFVNFNLNTELHEVHDTSSPKTFRGLAINSLTSGGSDSFDTSIDPRLYFQSDHEGSGSTYLEYDQANSDLRLVNKDTAGAIVLNAKEITLESIGTNNQNYNYVLAPVYSTDTTSTDLLTIGKIQTSTSTQQSTNVGLQFLTGGTTSNLINAIYMESTTKMNITADSNIFLNIKDGTSHKSIIEVGTGAVTVNGDLTISKGSKFQWGGLEASEDDSNNITYTSTTDNINFISSNSTSGRNEIRAISKGNFVIANGTATDSINGELDFSYSSNDWTITNASGGIKFSSAVSTTNAFDFSASGLTDGSFLTTLSTSTITDGGTSKGFNLGLTNMGTGSHTAYGILLDYNKTGITASGKTSNVYGLTVDLDDASSNVGTVNAYGIDISSAFTNSSGSLTSVGARIASSGADDNIGVLINCPDTNNTDLKITSSAENRDFFSITTTTNGATTIATTDHDASNANLTFSVDGTLDIDATGALQINSSAGAISVGNDVVAQAINIGTGAAARTITIGNATGATAVNVTTGTGGIALASTGTGDITIDSDDTLLLDADGVLELNSSAGAISIGNDAVAQAINVGTGAAARTITIGNVTGATAMNVNAGTGGIALASTGTGDITIDSDDTLLLDADGVLELNSSAGAISIGNDAVAQAINVGTGAAARTITIGNATGATAVNLTSGSGGITINGNIKATLPFFSDYDAVAQTTDTLVYADDSIQAGKYNTVSNDGTTITLPAVQIGATFIIVNIATDGGALLTISPNSNDKFLTNIAGSIGTDDKDIINTKATQKQYDYVKLVGFNADGWLIDEIRGIWVDQA